MWVVSIEHNLTAHSARLISSTYVRKLLVSFSLSLSVSFSLPVTSSLSSFSSFSNNFNQIGSNLSTTINNKGKAFFIFFDYFCFELWDKVEHDKSTRQTRALQEHFESILTGIFTICLIEYNHNLKVSSTMTSITARAICRSKWCLQSLH